MKSKAMFAVAVCSALALGQGVGAQQPAAGAQGGAAPAGRGAAGGGGGQPAPAHDYAVTAIPGVVAAGMKWEVVWGGPDNADGIVGLDDGSLIYAKEQVNRVDKIDVNNKVTPYITNTHGTGSVAVAADGRVFGDARTCTDPGGKPDECKEATAVVQLTPAYKVLADNINGMPLGRVNDLVLAKNGGIYFNGGGTYYMNPAGKVSLVGENVRSNGIMLSRDEKTLYCTSGGLLAFDVQPDGSVTNQRQFAMWEGGGGDGMTIDSEGRVYTSTGMGVQVVDVNGKNLGLIPTPRGVVSIAFAGPDKKWLYMVGSGAVDAAGKDLRTPEGVRNNAKSLLRIQMIAQGFKGRAK